MMNVFYITKFFTTIKLKRGGDDLVSPPKIFKMGIPPMFVTGLGTSSRDPSYD
jgi:hypothetical protein